MKVFHLTGCAALLLSGGWLFSGAAAQAADLASPEHRAGPPAMSGNAPADCIDPKLLADKMRHAGWQVVKQITIERDLMVLLAKQETGLLYRLAIDRCSGDLVDAHLLGGDHSGRDMADEDPEFPLPGDAGPAPGPWPYAPGLFAGPYGSPYPPSTGLAGGY
jgi:hypothetical protein